jgi:hypothetical protein
MSIMHPLQHHQLAIRLPVKVFIPHLNLTEGRVTRRSNVRWIKEVE